MHDLNPTALSDVYRLFTAIGYLAIQIACFNTIFDCIANMIGSFPNLHFIESTPCNQAGKRRDFLIFDLTVTSHFTFSYMFSFKRQSDVFRISSHLGFENAC